MYTSHQRSIGPRGRIFCMLTIDRLRRIPSAPTTQDMFHRPASIWSNPKETREVLGHTGCSLIIFFLSQISKYISDSSLSRFFLGVYTGLHAWTTKWQVEHQRCSRTGKSHLKDKKKQYLMNTLYLNFERAS